MPALESFTMNIDSIGHVPPGHRANRSAAAEEPTVAEVAEVADQALPLAPSVILSAPVMREAAWVGEIRQLAVNTAKRKITCDRDEELGPDEAELAVTDNRLLYLAMAAVTVTPPLRTTLPRRTQLLAQVKARSKADCKKRCGNAGHCNPENPLGCGGTYCREGIIEPEQEEQTPVAEAAGDI